VLKGHKFALLRQGRESGSLPAGFIPFDEIKAAGRENEKAAVDDAAVAPWLLKEAVTWPSATLRAPYRPGGLTAVTVANLPCFL